VIEPSVFTTMYLYSKLCPAGNETVAFHKGLLAVYEDAFSVMALLVSQLPRLAILPTIFTVCPKLVVLSSLKVTATVVAGVQAVAVEVGTAVVLVGNLVGSVVCRVEVPGT
jgi:hypothetical protein